MSLGSVTLTVLSLFICVWSELFLVATAHTDSQWEDLFLSLPSNETIYEYFVNLTAAPHIAGSKEDYASAVYTYEKFKEYGLRVRYDVHEVLLTMPISRSLRVLSPTPFDCPLKEAFVPVDPSSGDPRVVPTFNGYSPSGNVTAELVFVNYGRYEDYEALKAINVSVEGKIVIVKYGEIFRGLKAWMAQNNGAIGCVIYSDPADDGFVKGPVFPDGPWRPESGVQRGSAAFINLCPGDPRNPVCRVNSSQTYKDFMPRIPTLPISYGDAIHLLRDLGGAQIPAWRGGLNISYNIGPGPVIVNLATDMNFTVTNIWNVIAEIPGESEETILLGNHRDAWVFGGVDPSSGSASLLELGRCFGELLKRHWRPKRTIQLASWDGEEYNLLGSSAYADREQKFLQKSMIAYINVDATVGSNFFVDATHSLDGLLRGVAENITDPKTGKKLSEVWDRVVGTLGSGSDYTAFIHRYGVASITMGFYADDYSEDGNYHSVYDSLYWYQHFGDIRYLNTIVSIWGLTALRLADSEILPFNYSESAIAFDEYLQLEHDFLVQSGGAGLVNFSLLSQAIEYLRNESEILFNSTELAGPAEKERINRVLYQSERYLLDNNGLPLRPYFRHVIQAPHLFLGYGTQFFPGLDHAIFEKNWPEANAQVRLISEKINAAAANLSNHGASMTWLFFILGVAIIVSVIAFASMVYLNKDKGLCQRDYEKIEDSRVSVIDSTPTVVVVESDSIYKGKGYDNH